MKDVNLNRIKRQLSTYNSLDDLKELFAYLDSRYKHLEQKSADAKNREAWERLNQPPLKAGDIVEMSKELLQWKRGGYVRLDTGTELEIVAIQPRARRVWCKTPAEWNYFAPEIYFDGRDLRLLRRPETLRPEVLQEAEHEPLAVGNLQ